MASNIQPDNVDGEYPIAGTDNDSQGFRTNFANTSTNLQAAKDEIEELQSNTLVKATVGGATEIDNDMLGGVIKAAQLIDTRETIFAHPSDNAADINHQSGQYQTITTDQPLTLTFSDFPASTLGRVRVEINVTNLTHTVTIPTGFNGADYVDGYVAGVITFTQLGVIVLEFYSYDATTYTVNDLTRKSAAASAGINNVIEDIAPQLGGPLDVLAQPLTTSIVDGNIVLTPNGTGNIHLGTLVINGDQLVGPAQDNYVLAYNDATGEVALRGPPVIYKSYSATAMKAGTSYVGGFYISEPSSSTLTLGGTVAETIGNANSSYAAHAFIVASGASGSACVLTVSGTSINDSGTRTPADTEIIVADASAAATDQYFETVKKWLGEVTYTLTGSLTPSFTFNYGLVKYEDFGNRDYTVTDFEVTGQADNLKTEAGLNVELLYHEPSAFVYSAGAFVPNATPLVSLLNDHDTFATIELLENFAYKRAGYGQVISGSAEEGILMRVTTTEDKSISYMNLHIGVLLHE